MLKESSNLHYKKTFSKISNTKEEKMICKDGFCSLPNQKEMPKQGTTNDINLFDPI